METWAFRTDGTATRTDNGVVAFESGYLVARPSYLNGTEGERARIQFDADGSAEDFGISGDVLVFDRTPFDGPQLRYRRR